MNSNDSLEKEVLKRIREQINPNEKLGRHKTILKYFWIISCLFSVGLMVGLYIYPEISVQLENEYGPLMGLPSLFVIILIILGLRLQELKLMEFKNKSKFRDN